MGASGGCVLGRICPSAVFRVGGRYQGSHGSVGRGMRRTPPGSEFTQIESYGERFDDTGQSNWQREMRVVRSGPQFQVIVDANVVDYLGLLLIRTEQKS